MACIYELRVHHLLPRSYANGPGARAVIWVQGCTLGCAGCFNPETHAPDGGEPILVDDLFDRVVALGDTIEGISISGGEPLQQMGALLALLRRVRQESSLSVLIFTGYTREEIERLPDGQDLLAHVDVLVAGRYDRSRQQIDGLRSSTNQRVHRLSERYTMDELQAVPPGEVIIGPDGEVVVSGVDPVRW